MICCSFKTNVVDHHCQLYALFDSYTKSDDNDVKYRNYGCRIIITLENDKKTMESSQRASKFMGQSDCVLC